MAIDLEDIRNRFKPGTIIYHKATGEKFVVISITNKGLITVRRKYKDNLARYYSQEFNTEEDIRLSQPKDSLMSHLLCYLVAIILLCIGLSFKLPCLFLLITSGLILGVYRGLYDEIIWSPGTKPEKSVPHRLHKIFVHVLCSVSGSVALYFLIINITHGIYSAFTYSLGVRELVLFLIALLGYMGLLPRALWSYSNRGGGSF